MAVVSYKDTMKRFLRTPMQKTFTFLGVTLILIIVFLMGAIRPTLATISDLNKEINEREQIDEQLQFKLNTLDTLKKEYADKEEDLQFIDAFFPQNSDYSLLMASLEKVVQQYGFTLDALQIAIDDVEGTGSALYPGMQEVDVKLIVTGRTDNVTDLVEHLEALPVIPEMEKVGITATNKSSSESQIVINMTVYKVR